MPRMSRTAMTLGDDVEKLAKKMKDFHKAESVSAYLRGLIVLDALIAKGEAEGVGWHEFPAWLLAEYPVEFIRWMREDYKDRYALRKAKESVTLEDFANRGARDMAGFSKRMQKHSTSKHDG